MARRNPKRGEVERLLEAHPGMKACQIAEETGLDVDLGQDKATDYIRGVRKSMRKKGRLPRFHPNRFATDEDRLEDITTLFELRKGKMSKRAARTMLLLNCYLRLRSKDDDVHMDAIGDTYRKNDNLDHPLPLDEAIRTCEIALERYNDSIDEEKNREAIAKGYPGSGLNYTSESLRLKCEISAEEIPLLKTIKEETEE